MFILVAYSFTMPEAELLLQRKQRRAAAARLRRANETPDQQSARREANRQSNENRRRDATPVQQSARRDGATEQEAELLIQRKQRKAAAARLRRANATPDQQSARRATNQESNQNRRMDETPDQQSARRSGERESQQDRRANATPDQRASQRHTNAQQKRLTAKERKTEQDAENNRNVLNFETTVEDVPDNPCLQPFFEKDPEVSAMMFHSNAGNCRFSDVVKLDDENEDVRERATKRLIQEVKEEVLTKEEYEELMSQFFKETGRGGYGGYQFPASLDAKISSCGCCGVKEVDRNRKKPFKEISLADLDILKLDTEDADTFMEGKMKPAVQLPCDDQGTLKSFKWHLAYDIFDDNTGSNDKFWLIPDLVHQIDKVDGGQEPATYLCHDCHKDLVKPKKQEDIVIPDFCVKNVSFGSWRRVGLQEPNLMERLMIAKVRHHFRIVKIVANAGGKANLVDHTHSAIRGHSILFNHDAPDIAAQALWSIESLKQCIKLHFVGPSGKMDWLMKNTINSTVLNARPHVLLQWFSFLRELHTDYKNDTEPLPTFEQLKTQLIGVKKAICDDAFLSCDEAAVSKERITGDDVAGVRLSAASDGRNSPNLDQINDPVLKECYLADPGGTERLGDEVQQTLRMASELIGGIAIPGSTADVPQRRTVFESKRDAEPLNEFEMGDSCLTAAFPTTFCLGHAYQRKSGTLTAKQRFHLLNQYTRNAATNRELLFYLFDQLQRHQALSHISAKVRSNKNAFTDYYFLVQSLPFREQLARAIRRPKSREAAAVMAKLMPVLSMASPKNTCFGATVSKDIEVQLRNLCRHYGPPSIFLTIAPNDIGDPTALRLTFYNTKNNKEFPNVTSSDYYDRLIEGSEVIGQEDIRFPCSYDERLKATVRDVVASVTQYQNLIGSVLSILLGVSPNTFGRDRVTNRTAYYKSQPKGIFGHLLSVYGVNEAQSRSALHLHLMGFGSLSPQLLQGAAHVSEVCSAIQKALDSMYSAEIPRSHHVCHLIKQFMKKKFERVPAWHPTFTIPPSIANDTDRFEHHVYCSACKLQIHSHSFTCHKGFNGHTGCRLNYMCGSCSKTKPIQLSDDRDENNVPIPMQEVAPPPAMQSTREQPIIPKDNRDIVWELQRRILEELPEVDDASEGAASELKANIFSALEDVSVPSEITEWINGLNIETLRLLYEFISSNLPDANGNVVAYNPVLTACCASNTAAYPLGNTTQANSSCFYLSPYMGKQKAAIDVILSTLEKSLEDIEKRPSGHADSGSDSRSVTHLFQRMLNSLSRKIEICDTQAVAALLGMGPVVCTDNFSYFGPNEAANYALANQIDDSNNDPDRMDLEENDDSGDDTDFICNDTEEEQRGWNSAQPELQEILLQLGPNEQPTLDRASNRKRGFRNMSTNQNSEQTSNTNSDECSRGNADGNHDVEGSVDGADFPDGAEDENDDNYLADLMVTDAVNTWNLGKTAVYKIDDNKNSIPIHYNTHHRFRGEGLRHLTRSEYEATVRVQKKTSTTTSTTPTAATGSRPGHVKNKRFDFDAGHVLAASHEQVIRTKQCVLIFTGRQPPIPSDETSAKEKNKFARYYLAAFRPEPDLFAADQVNDLQYDWSALCSYLLHLETSNLLISKMRLNQIWKCMFNMLATHSSKVKLSDFRSRARKTWSQQELACAASTYTLSQLENQKRAKEGDETTAGSRRSTALTSRSLIHQNAFLNDCRNSRNIFRKILGAAKTVSTPKVDHSACSTATTKKVLDMVAKIKSIDTASTANDPTVPPTIPTATADQDYSPQPTNQTIDLDDFIANKLPSHVLVTEGQRAVAKKVIDYFNELGPWYEGRPPVARPLKLLCLGGPGAGKTTIIRPLASLSEDHGIGHVVRVSYCGVAAGLMDGSTLLKTFDCGYSKTDKEFIKIFDLSFDRITKLGLRLKFPRIGLIIIDECSTMSPTHLATIDARLRQLTGLDMSYGGIGIILIGDFMQNLPVKQTSFGTAVMEDLEIRMQGNSENSAVDLQTAPTPATEPTLPAVAITPTPRLQRRTNIIFGEQQSVTPTTEQTCVTSTLQRRSSLPFSSRGTLEIARNTPTEQLEDLNQDVNQNVHIEHSRTDGNVYVSDLDLSSSVRASTTQSSYINADRRRQVLGRPRSEILFNESTPEDISRITATLNGTGPTIERIGTATVQHDSIRTLRPTTWLNDEVINYFFLLLSSRDKTNCEMNLTQKRCHFFTSFFMTALVNISNFDDGTDASYSYANVQRWSTNSVPGTSSAFFPSTPATDSTVSNTCKIINICRRCRK